MLDEARAWLAPPRRRALEVALLLEDPGEDAPDLHAIGLALLDVVRMLASAGPVVIAIDGVARELVTDLACSGVYAPPGDARAIADAISGLADDADARQRLGTNGRAWVEKHASREVVAANYERVLQRLVERKGRHP